MTVMELMHRLNLKHLFVFELPRSGLLAHFSSVTVALPRFMDFNDPARLP